MYRKIGLISSSLHQPERSDNAGDDRAASVIIFIVINLKKKPFMTVVLNDLESLSLITSMVTVYCGIFYISNTPTRYIEDYPELKQTALVLDTSSSLFLFFMILLVNLIFLVRLALSDDSRAEVQIQKES